jgi:hypothetical protein
MKWPWVARERYEYACVERDAARSAACKYAEPCATVGHEARRQERQQDRYDALLEKYHALRQQGHAIPEPRPAAQPVAEEFPATVETAIVVASEGNKGLERHLRAVRDLRLARGEDHSAVARLIEKGDGSDD